MAETVGAAQLEISADVSGVETGVTKAKKSLDGLADAARVAGKGASAGLDGIGAGAAGAAGKVEASTRNMIGSIQRQIAAMEAGNKSGSDYYRVLATQRGISADALKPYLDQLDQVSAKQAAAAAASASGAVAIGKVGVSAAQTAAAMRQVPAQLTDIIVGLQAGQAPLTVLLQQGGQLKDMFGGVVPAAKALGSAVLGLINPYTLAAAALAGLAVAYYEGSKEADAFARALILTNNAAGLSIGQLQEMAQRISAISGTQSEASAALAAFAGSTALAGTNIEKFAAAAAKMERITGQAVGETVKQFEELAKSPVDASIKLNEKTNFLTESLYRQIRVLDEQGKTAQAAGLAMNAAADDAERKMAQLESRLGYVERAWKAAGSAAKGAWDDFLNIGRPETLESRLASAKKALGDYQSTLPGRRTTEQVAAVQKFGGEDALKNQIAGLQDLIDTQNKSAKLDSEATQRVASRIAFDKEVDKYLSNKVQMTRELSRAEELATKAGATRAEKEALFANIREKYKEKGGGKDTSRVDAMAQAKLDIQAIKSASEERVSIYNNGERMLEATRQAGLISEAEYWDAKRQFLNINAQEQIDALNAENARLEAQKLNTKDALDRDRQVLANKTKIASIQQTLGANQYILDMQEAAGIRAKAAALLTARQAAESYLDTQVRQQQLDLEGMGQGTVNRSMNRGLAQIEERYASQRLELSNQRALAEMEGKFTEEARQQYDARLGIIEEFKAKSLASYRDYYQQLTDAQASWSLGASEGLNNYLAGAQNVFSQTEQAVGNAFRGMEDALVQFVTTGKLSFSDMANSIVADITRIIVKQQVANATVGLMGSLGTSLANFLPGDPLDNIIKLTGNFAGRAAGGPVSAGGLYRVNEQGPELLNVNGQQFLMMGNQGGSVTPNSRGDRSIAGGQTITVNVQMPNGANRQTGLQFGQAVARQLTIANNRNG